jgi:uncharacterized membrane protein YbaN (DUF454 family)
LDSVTSLDFAHYGIIMSKTNNDLINNSSRNGNDSNQEQIVQNKFLRWLLIFFGTLFVGLGIIGIFLPILPTTPFLLLAAWCYSRSSKRYYNWLISNKRFGKYIKDYREGRGIPIKAKITAISLLWITILISVIFIVNYRLIQIIMIITAAIVTIYIISIKPKK